MLWAPFALDLELAGQLSLWGRGRPRRVLEIRTNPDGYEGGGTSLSTGISVWWGLHAGACLRMWSAGESGP